MLKIFVLYVFLLAPFLTNAQRTDYVVKDSTYITGKVDYLKNKGLIKVTRAKSDPPATYGPYDVSEFSMAGDLFQALPMDGRKFFFKRIIAGETSLYKRKRLYILKKSDTLTTLTRKTFRHVLRENFSCKGDQRLMSQMPFRKRFITTFVKTANNSQCNINNFPYRKFGIAVGYSPLTVEVASDKFPTARNVENTFMPGVFMDLPVFPFIKTIHVSAEGYYIQTPNRGYLLEEAVRTRFFQMKTSGFIAPISLKWSVASGKIKPFVRAGAMLTYLKLNSTEDIIESTELNDEVLFEVRKFENATVFSAGFVGGAGVEIPVLKHRNVHLEVKYIKSPGMDFQDMRIALSGTFFSAGFNF